MREQWLNYHAAATECAHKMRGFDKEQVKTKERESRMQISGRRALFIAARFCNDTPKVFETPVSCRSSKMGFYIFMEAKLEITASGCALIFIKGCIRIWM